MSHFDQSKIKRDLQQVLAELKDKNGYRYTTSIVYRTPPSIELLAWTSESVPTLVGTSMSVIGIIEIGRQLLTQPREVALAMPAD